MDEYNHVFIDTKDNNSTLVYQIGILLYGKEEKSYLPK